ncbi:MAG: PspC domain-containing protein [Acidobacteria bacterium]|nr:PspC domain-containing protein [Acidobacteriota bacterium]
MKKLYRSSYDKMLGGVFGGLGEYLEVDSTILRLTYVLLTAFTALLPGIIGYIIAVIIIPSHPGYPGSE